MSKYVSYLIFLHTYKNIIDLLLTAFKLSISNAHIKVHKLKYVKLCYLPMNMQTI